GCRQHEVGAVEYVEALRFKLQIHAFGELEGLAQGHVGEPDFRSEERIASEVAYAAKARRSEDRRSARTARIVPASGKLLLGWLEAGQRGIRSIIATVIQVEVTPAVGAVGLHK